MQTYNRPLQAVAIVLACLAGFIDAVAFLDVGGFFVSFMSGNSTRLGVGLATHPYAAMIAGALILAFVLGVMTGSLAGALAGAHRRPAVLAVVAALLGLSLLLHLNLGPGWKLTCSLPLALAMGAVNATFERNGEVSFGVTYMTGALVKLGQRLFQALSGGAPLGWLPHLLLWAGLASGAWAGAWTYSQFGYLALAAAVGLVAVLTVAVALIDRAERRQSTATV
ncbi:MAG: DUF1275 domain-containing protein [Caulobacter sp.]|nr:DUF1275 domain-containing protein [Caulobacter sp.]